MKIVNQALLQVANEIAREYGYIETDRKIENLMLSDFWGTRFQAVKYYFNFHKIPEFESVRYSYPVWEDDLDEKKRRPKITFRVRFANPRIDIDFPDGGYVGLEYSPASCSFEEAQIFGESGYRKLPVIKERIEQLINEIANGKEQ